MNKNKNKVEIGQHVASDLFAAEDHIDEAYAALGRLAQTMGHSRREMGLSAVVGDTAFGAVGDALGQVAAARAQVVAAHHELARVQRRTGLDTVDFGGLEKPPAASAEQAQPSEFLRVAKA
ncbi:MAG: hypothetical protein ACXW3D_04880 [Caulobacteraceae bacterium]